MQGLLSAISRLEIFFRYVDISNIRSSVLQIVATFIIFLMSLEVDDRRAHLITFTFFPGSATSQRKDSLV